jgi:starch phosphorylase
VRDRLIESWNDTQQYFREQDPKRVYYLSMEFLMGRSLTNSLYNLEVKGTFSEGLRQLGYSLEDLVEKERDAALGNGGLGRLAACFLGLDGERELTRVGVRHPVPVRDVSPGDARRVPAREPRLLA